MRLIGAKAKQEHCHILVDASGPCGLNPVKYLQLNRLKFKMRLKGSK